MFTGIIEKKAKILDIQGSRFVVENLFGDELQVGQSVAHDGGCMTLESIKDSQYSFFVMQESFEKLNFHEKRIGDYFNIERCLRANDRIDGHFVSGHIDTTGKISFSEIRDDTSLVLGISFAKEFSKYTIEKGSIALNGVSLTIVETREGYISVSLIPLTQDWTNLGAAKIGDAINIEFDMLGKYILNK
ncbi:riboflavin synthase [Candidatus Gracilibacteria bacterium]|nr:riboflavin synthase [Candidatus Gracilibacteria bacterium]